MRKLKQLWQALERIPGLSAVPGLWRERCGPDFPVLEPFLRPTERQGSTYPCPYPTGSECPRRIIDDGEGHYVAICRDPWKICPDVPLMLKEVLHHCLDIPAFSRAIATPLGIRWQAPVERGDQTWSIGISARRTTRNQPVFFICLPDSTRFEQSFKNLLLELSGPFLIVAPTGRHRSAEVQQYLQARGIGFISLEDDLLLDHSGQLVCPEIAEAAEAVTVTPVADRERAVAAFIQKHGCRVRDLQEAAGVHESDYYKWRAGKLPDHYAACRDIERILQFGLPKARQTGASRRQDGLEFRVDSKYN